MSKNKFFTFNISKYFYTFWCVVFMLCLLLTLGVQLIFTTSNGRIALSDIESIEAMGPSMEEGVKLGLVQLTISGTAPSKNIKVLNNGKVIAIFLQEQITVTVSDNSLLEIQSDVGTPFYVNIEKVSSNVDIQLKSTQINSSIVTIARLFVK